MLDDGKKTTVVGEEVIFVRPKISLVNSGSTTTLVSRSTQSSQ